MRAGGWNQYYVSKFEDKLPVQERESECYVIHEDVVTKVRAAQLTDEQAADVALVFQALGDPTRVPAAPRPDRMEMCVCDLAAVLGMTQSAVLHQLRYLRNLRIIKRRKVGRMMYLQLWTMSIF